MSRKPDPDQYRQRLEQRREALTNIDESSKAASETVELDQTRVGRLSRMDAMQQQAMAKATHQRRLHEIKRIDAALQRIEEGEYGDCVSCGEPIQEKRLDFDPAASLCIECAESRS